MTSCKRPLLILALLTVALAALAGVARWLERARPTSPVGLEEEAEARLERSREALLRRIESRRQVARRLLAGRVTLREAAALFRELNREPEGFPGQDRYRTPGASAEEKLCRQVIGWARTLAEEQGNGAALAALARLEAELAKLLERGGDFRLRERLLQPAFEAH